jgi:SAM-dependent methyltransferase
MHWCFRCGVAASIYQYDPAIYSTEYQNEYAERSRTDLGRRITAQRIGLVASFTPLGRRVLDFGCGFGNFIGVAEKAGYWECRGIEANEGLARAAQAHSSVAVDPYDGPDRREYGCITFFDSLEHVMNPKVELRDWIPHLMIGGVIVVAMPELPMLYQATSDVAYMQREFKDWRHNKPKEHLWAFSRHGLKKLLTDVGLKVVFETNLESYLRHDPVNPTSNIQTVVARKVA